MSDNTENSFLSGNLRGRSRGERRRDENFFAYPRRTLVEECECISMADIRSRFNRKELLGLAEGERTLRTRVGAWHYEIRLCTERHQQTYSYGRRSNVVRIWILCSCGRRARKLYIDPQSLSFPGILACRTCQRLRYLVQNSGKTKWFRNIVKPFRKLIRRQERLFTRNRSQRVRDELEFIQGQIEVLMQRAQPKCRNACGRGFRRRYRDARLLSGSQGFVMSVRSQ